MAPHSIPAQHGHRAVEAAGSSADVFLLRTTGVGDAALIKVTGELDLATCGRLLEAVAGCVRRRQYLITVDMSDVTFCDCSGLRALLEGRRKAAAYGGAVRVLTPSPPVARLLALVRVAELLGVDHGAEHQEVQAG